MVRHTQEVVIKKPVAEVFDFIATRNRENHPRWEPEVLEIRPLTEGPIRVGSRAKMVRKDFGKVSTTTYEVTDLQPQSRIAFRHIDGPMDFEISFNFTPIANGTNLVVEVGAQPHGAMRMLTPLFKIRMPKTGARLTSNVKRLIEQGADAVVR